MSSVYFDLYDKNKKLKKNDQYFLAFSKAIKAVDYIEKENLSDVPVIWPLVEVINYLEENPGCKQSEIWSILDIDGREGANLIHYTEQLNAIKREKENGKNILYSKEKPSLKKIRNKTSTRKNINRKRVNKKQFQEKNKSLFDKIKDFFI